ncbi:MAG: sugar phosphate isomerase/epimerase [Candidatus Latescibacteria bacterium]|nr:sugar phosphate isomerase/epimerase [Candidatus Latescibacterota bacterium]
MKIGYSTWGMPTLPIDTALEHLKKLGFEGVEPTVIPGWSTELDTLDKAERRRIRQLFDQHGLEMPAVAGHRSLIEEDPQAHTENWRRLTGALDLCAEWAGPEGLPCLDTTLGGGPDDWAPKRELILERLGKLVEYAAGRGVVVAIEPHVSSSLDLPDKALWLLAQINSPYFKLNFDISHFEVMGLPTAPTVAALAPHAAHTHVKDQRGVVPDFEFLIPGEGPFDFVTYLREMKKAGYTGHITAEVSIMVQRRPNYDPLAAATLTYQTLERAFRQAGLRP